MPAPRASTGERSLLLTPKARSLAPRTCGNTDCIGSNIKGI